MSITKQEALDAVIILQTDFILGVANRGIGDSGIKEMLLIIEEYIRSKK